MGQLLLDERPLVVLPSLVMKLGFERAVILQQIHWLLQQPRNGVEHDGYKWVYGTYVEWCELYFPFWSPEALRKHIVKLEKAGYLISAELRKAEWDHTKYYRVNEEALGTDDTACGTASVRDEDTTTMRPAEPHHYTETSTETTSKTTTDEGDNARARGEVFRVWGENMPGTLSPILSEDINTLIDETSPASVIHGIRVGVQAGARNYKYIAACARSHAQGKEHVPVSRPSKSELRRFNNGNGSGFRSDSGSEYPADDAAIIERKRQQYLAQRASLSVPGVQGHGLAVRGGPGWQGKDGQRQGPDCALQLPVPPGRGAQAAQVGGD
jgi:hypothetical protein